MVEDNSKISERRGVLVGVQWQWWESSDDGAASLEPDQWLIANKDMWVMLAVLHTVAPNATRMNEDVLERWRNRWFLLFVSFVFNKFSGGSLGRGCSGVRKGMIWRNRWISWNGIYDVKFPKDQRINFKIKCYKKRAQPTELIDQDL